MPTLDIPITVNADDNQEDGSTFSTGFTTGLLGFAFAVNQHLVLAWSDGVDVPRGSTINVARVDFVADDAGTFVAGSILSDIFGVDEDDHVPPTTHAQWVTDHGIHTTATTVWDFTAQASGSLQTPSIVGIIQELIDRPGWASGNRIGLHIDDGGTVSACQEVAYNEHATLASPILHIEYTAAGGAGGFGAIGELPIGALPAAGDASATVTPGAIARSLIPNTATAAGSAKTTPSTIARSFLVNAVVVKGSAVAAPGAITLAVVIPGASPTNSDGPVVTPGPIARSLSVLAASVVGPAVVQIGPHAYAVVLPQSSIKVPGSAAPATTPTSVTLPLVTLRAGAVVETGMTVTIAMPSPTLKGGSVVSPDSIDLAAVASQVTIVIGGPEDWSEIIFVDEMW